MKIYRFLRYYILVFIVSCVSINVSSNERIALFKYYNSYNLNDTISSQIANFKLETTTIANNDTLFVSPNTTKLIVNKEDELYYDIIMQSHVLGNSLPKNSTKLSKSEIRIFINRFGLDVYLISYLKISNHFKSLLFEIKYDSNKAQENEWDKLITTNPIQLTKRYILNFKENRILSIAEVAIEYNTLDYNEKEKIYTFYSKNKFCFVLAEKKRFKYTINQSGKIKLTQPWVKTSRNLN